MIELFLVSAFLIIGYGTGILVGMLGIGGGIIFVPLLYFLLPFTGIDISQISYLAIGTSLFAGCIASIGSGSKHFRSNNVDGKKTVLLSAGSVLASFIVPYFVVEVKPLYLQIAFAAVFMVVAVKMMLENSASNFLSVQKSIPDAYLFFFGISIGTISAFVGIGGGILLVPILIFFYLVDVKKAIGTSAVVTAFTMLASTASYGAQDPKGIIAGSQVGYIYLMAGIPMGCASFIGAFRGVKIMNKTSSRAVKKIFSFLLIVVVLKIILEL